MTEKNTTIYAVEFQGADAVITGFSEVATAAEGTAASAGKSTEKAAQGSKNWSKALKETGTAAGDVASRIGALGGAAGKQFADMTSQVLQLGAAFTGGPLIAGLAATGAAIAFVINKVEESYAKEAALNDEWVRWAAAHKKTREDTIALLLRERTVLSDNLVAQKRAAAESMRIDNERIVAEAAASQARLDYLKEKADSEFFDGETRKEIAKEEEKFSLLMVTLKSNETQAKRAENEAQTTGELNSLAKRVKGAGEAAEKEREIWRQKERERLELNGVALKAMGEADDAAAERRRQAKEEAKREDEAYNAQAIAGYEQMVQAREQRLKTLGIARIRGEAEIAGATADIAIAAEERSASESFTIFGRAGALRRATALKNAQDLAALAEQTKVIQLEKVGEEADQEVELLTKRTKAAIAMREAETRATVAAMERQQAAEAIGTSINTAFAASEIVVGNATNFATQELQKFGDINRDNYREMLEFTPKARDALVARAQAAIFSMGLEAGTKSIFETGEAVRETALGFGMLAIPGMQGQAAMHFVSAGTHMAAASAYATIGGSAVGASFGIGAMRGKGGLVGTGAEAATGIAGSTATPSGQGSTTAGPTSGTGSGNTQSTAPVVVNFVYEAGSMNAGDTQRLGRGVARGVRAANRDGFARRQMRQ